MNDDRAGTTEYDRRERQEFAGIRAFATLREAREELNQLTTITGESDED